MADAKWSTEEMIQNAGNWSLAGDAALLNNLKAFSERVLGETVRISGNVDNLLNNLNDVAIKLDLARNEFQSLRNSQFIESRVYEDDETVDNNTADNDKSQTVELTEDEKQKVIENVISDGLKVMERYYDKVAVTTGQDDETGYIRRTKDRYSHRPLPYLVGSREWYIKWHVGLIESDSDESEKADSPKIKELESTVELDMSARQDGPVANSTFNESVDLVSTVAPSVTTNQTFAEQLAQKLGAVIAGDVNRNSIQRNVDNKYSTGLFSDEPPPLDDPEMRKNESPKDEVDTDKKGAQYQPPKGLFDESEESSGDEGDIFSKAERIKCARAFLQPFKTSAPFLDEEPPVLDSNEEKNLPKKQKPFGGVSIMANDKIPSISSQKEKKSLFDDSSEDEFLPVTKPGKKIDLFEDKAITEPPKTGMKKISLFDDDDDFLKEDDDIFGSLAPGKLKDPETGADKQIKSNLFEDLEPESSFKARSLFEDIEESSRKEESRSSETKKKFTLFDSYEEEDTDEDIFIKDSESKKVDFGAVKEDSDVKKKKQPEKKPKNAGRKEADLFGSTDDEDIFTKDIGSKKIVPDEDLKANNKNQMEEHFKKAMSQMKKKTNLFENSEDEDIFNKDGGSEKMDPEEHLEANNKKQLEEHLKKTTNQAEKKANLFRDSEAGDIFNNYSSSKKIDCEENLDKKEPEEKLKNTVNQMKKIVNLFESSEDEDTESFGEIKEDLENSEKQSEEILKDKPSLFGSSEDEDHDEDIFGKALNEPEAKYGGGIEENAKESDEKKPVVEEKIFDENGEFSSEKPSLEVLKNEIVSEAKQNVKENASMLVSSEDEVAHIEKLNIFATLQTKSDKGAPEIKVSTASPTETLRNKSSRVVNLFDPTPPPDDDFWDNSDDSDLDAISINDDFNRDPTPQQRSSLFDNEPPSLNHDESSGIVRDQNVTRAEPDDESFYPGASSSRRLSSDIFREEQSQDSFFLTKNQTGSRPQLSSLPEDVKSPSKLTDLTPSGRFDDLLEEDPSVFEVPDSVESTKNVQTGSFGKLKHNLEINVGALLPGAPSPKFRSIVKSVSLDDTVSSGTGFQTEILPNVTKDRAKIPARRRPSTRRGRQEALRNSVADFRLSGDEEIPQKEPEEEGVKGISMVFNSSDKKSSIFDESGSEDEDLFGNGSKVKKTEGFGSKSKSLFDDSDGSDEDLFGAKRDPLKTKEGTRSVKAATVKKLVNKEVTDDPLSLFD